MDPDVAISDDGTIEEFLGMLVLRRAAIHSHQILTVFGGIGLLLVLIGVFSVMAYTVSLQTALRSAFEWL